MPRKEKQKGIQTSYGGQVDLIINFQALSDGDFQDIMTTVCYVICYAKDTETSFKFCSLKNTHKELYATLKIPKVDRGPADPRNLLVVVLKINNALHTVACRQGILASKYIQRQTWSQ
ncbi:hypothetical protein T01_5505 [Trichinella spiralis]|uniref:Uncharacterized protein n=1 Tax=Trichinella spiralis TaxID=6334 RepID=A0A0V1AZN1_TRISP|nr:hypothetical protein T01_5505 [Trichinella spiralis]